MQTLRLPLRVDRSGTLERCDGVDAVLSLLGTMLVTSSTLWPEAPWFGLLEVAEKMNTSLSDQEGLRDAFNRALEELGIDWTHVVGVTSEPKSAQSGNVRLGLSLSVREGEVVFRQLHM